MSPMPRPAVSASALLPVAPEVAYAVIADYHDGHPRILPRPPFTGLVVEQGGVGAGTVATATVKLAGLSSSFRFEVTEPEPGRVLVETNDAGSVTTFTVEPVEGRHDTCRATIETQLPGGRGPFARLNRWFLRRLLRDVLPRELERLEQVTASRT